MVCLEDLPVYAVLEIGSLYQVLSMKLHHPSQRRRRRQPTTFQRAEPAALSAVPDVHSCSCARVECTRVSSSLASVSRETVIFKSPCALATTEYIRYDAHCDYTRETITTLRGMGRRPGAMIHASRAGAVGAMDCQDVQAVGMGGWYNVQDERGERMSRESEGRMNGGARTRVAQRPDARRAHDGRTLTSRA
jgi:hypothetical protein